MVCWDLQFYLFRSIFFSNFHISVFFEIIYFQNYFCQKKLFVESGCQIPLCNFVDYFNYFSRVFYARFILNLCGFHISYGMWFFYIIKSRFIEPDRSWTTSTTQTARFNISGRREQHRHQTADTGGPTKTGNGRKPIHRPVFFSLSWCRLLYKQSWSQKSHQCGTKPTDSSGISR